MELKGIIQFALFSLLSATVKVSPISSEEDTGISENNFNDIEDLFFISDTEEQSYEKDTWDNAVIEKVKARILNGLHLKEPPKTHPPVPALQFLDTQSHSWGNATNIPSRDSRHRNTKSEFLNSEIVPNTCFHQNGPQCLRFQIQIPKHISNVQNSSSELWLYKKDGVTEYTITQITNEPNQTILQKEIFDVFNQTKSAGWTRFDVTPLMRRVSTNLLDLEVYSRSINVPLETGNDKNPLLVLFVNSSEENNRPKRAAFDCDEDSSSCCRKKIYISFKDVGWDDWIVQPEGYNANACKESCQNRLDLTHKHHTHILLRLISKAGANNSEIADTIHCTPKSYKPLAIIYTDEKGLKVISNLPDMSVSECGCA